MTAFSRRETSIAGISIAGIASSNRSPTIYPVVRYAPVGKGEGTMPVQRPYRVRRSCLAVPASSERFITKARGLPADEVFLDLEDAVAPAAKPQARANRSE